MNLLLLEPNQYTQYTQFDQVIIQDARRVTHIRETLKLTVGDSIKVGVRGGNKGEAVVVQLTSDHVVLSQMVLDIPPPAKLPLTLVLALPRPLVLRRLVTDCVTMGVAQLVILQSNRVEKSYWQSQVFTELEELVTLGLEQAGDTVAPVIMLRKRFRPFVEDELPALILNKAAYVAHPPSPQYASQPAPCGVADCVLIVGAEGGFVPYEIDLLQAQGCQLIHMGQRILRTETAVPALIGRMMPLLR